MFSEHGLLPRRAKSLQQDLSLGRDDFSVCDPAHTSDQTDTAGGPGALTCSEVSRWRRFDPCPGAVGPFVIDAFFMRTADNSVRHHDGLGSGRVDERKHLFCYTGIFADICPFGEPAPKVCGLGMLRRNNADRELGCRPIVRAVESDGSYGVAAKSSLSSLLSRSRARSII